MPDIFIDSYLDKAVLSKLLKQSDACHQVKPFLNVQIFKRGSSQTNCLGEKLCSSWRWHQAKSPAVLDCDVELTVLCPGSLFTVLWLSHVGWFNGVLHKVACCSRIGRRSLAPACKDVVELLSCTLHVVAEELEVLVVVHVAGLLYIRIHNDNSCVWPEPRSWVPHPQNPRALHQNVGVWPFHWWNRFQVLCQTLLSEVSLYLFIHPCF